MPQVTELKLKRKSRLLQVTFEDGSRFELPFELLRVYSPSAEVRGHGAGPIKLVPGKAEVQILAVEPVGHYAVKLVFDDGHDSGLYSWDTLYQLGLNQESLWQDYLQRLKDAGQLRHSIAFKAL